MDNEKIWAIFNSADILASQDEVNRAIDRMADEISERLRDQCPLVLCVMNGGLIIAGQILPKLRFPLQVDYIHATRYGNEASGNHLSW